MQAALNPVMDPTAGLELVSGSEVNLESPRAIFLAADLLDPARSRDINLQYGGEEIPNRCLRRTNGLLPRCFITPMEVWGEGLPAELMPDGIRLDYKVKGSLTLPMGMQEAAPLGEYNPRLNNKPLFWMPYYPGELIVDALGIPTGEKRGIVEIKALFDVSYGEGYDEFQRLFFPEDYKLPLQLTAIRDHIESVGGSVADPDAKSVAEDMIASCNQSTEYLSTMVSLGNTQLQQRVHPAGHIYALTPKLRHFAAQLGLKLSLADSVQSKVDAVSATGISGEQLEAILSRVLREVNAAPIVPEPAE